MRRTRRSRKLRYRKARFSNRKRTEKWLPPSIKSKLECHLTLVAKLHRFLPIGKIVVEIASFDIQKIKNPEIKGVNTFCIEIIINADIAKVNQKTWF